MKAKPCDRYCRTCGALLPLPTPEQALKGGRPRLYCGRTCKDWRGRHAEIASTLRAYGTLASVRGDTSLAARFHEYAEAVSSAASKCGVSREFVSRVSSDMKAAGQPRSDASLSPKESETPQARTYTHEARHGGHRA